MVFFNQKLIFFIHQLNWHYKQKHISFIFPRHNLILLFLRFLLKEGFIFSYQIDPKLNMIIIFLKYLHNKPAIIELKKYPKYYWYNFQNAKKLNIHKSDMHLQTHLIIVFNLHGFSLLNNVAINQGGWLLCKCVV